MSRAAEMQALMERLFPICRSLTGPGVRETLAILGEVVPLTVHEVPSGTRCFDWTVPDEWTIRDAYVADMDGNRLIDFAASNLHVLGYSEPFDGVLSRDELEPHLHSRPDLPDAIPYATSYYQRRWGFCLSERQRQALGPGPFRVRIDSTLAPGSLTYGELVIPASEPGGGEVLLSTYVCHPSMANNELSGPVMTAMLARELMARPSRRHAYRIVFVPETIGALAYLSRHLDHLRRNVVAGWVVTCVGGPGGPTYLRSRWGDRLVDRVTAHVLHHSGEPCRIVEFPERGSDERQYCAPGIDLPVGSLCRAKYYDYPEYHTSLDDLSLVNGDQLEASLALYLRCIDAVEHNRHWRVTTLGEPCLGRRGLYPTLGAAVDTARRMRILMALVGYCDGETDLLTIAERHGDPVWDYYDAVAVLRDHGLLQEKT